MGERRRQAAGRSATGRGPVPAASVPAAALSPAKAAGCTGTAPPPVAQPARNRRQLDRVRVMRLLGRAPRPLLPGTVDILTDLSGSMWGGNDAQGLRHEAALLFLEALAQVPAIDDEAAWAASCRSFDLRSPLDFAETHLVPARMRSVADRLLSQPMGGSSNLGPSLADALANPSTRPGPSLCIVKSDFELFDADVAGVLDQLVHAPYDAVLALVFSSAPPAALTDSRVHVVRIDPAQDDPARVAEVAMEVLRSIAPDHPLPPRRRPLRGRRRRRGRRTPR